MTTTSESEPAPYGPARGEQWWYNDCCHVDLQDLADQIVCDTDTALKDALVFNTRQSRLRVPQCVVNILASVNEEWSVAYNDYPCSLTSKAAEEAHTVLLGALEKCRPVVYSPVVETRIDMRLYAPADASEVG